MKNWTRSLGVLAALLVAGVATAAGGQLASARSDKQPTAAAPTANCNLGNGIKHVIYVQFDNTHLLRDNPNVPSDLEQMPNLLNFIKSNGTLLSNDHTILISHTGGGILSTLTGLYPDRHGQAVSNSYGYFKPDGSVGFSSTFKYWTDQTDGGNPANLPPTPSADPNYNMVNNDPASLGGTGLVRNAPAPWVPFARAGCDVGNVGVANTVLENNNSIIFRTSPTPLPNPNAFATDPTGDMTKVFGENSPEWIEGKNSQLAPSGTAARALAQTDFVGLAIHCAQGGGICNHNTANARPDSLPDEKNGYTGFRALFGAKYVDPAITKDAAHPNGQTCVKATDGTAIADPFDQCGFPGFDGMLAKNTLGYVAQMQENGVPVTFAYISDAHDNHGKSGNIHVAYGPGEAGYVKQLQDYDKAFGDFFARLKADGINKSNTLFVFTVEEGDHFAGTPPNNAPCDGVTKPCTYDHVTEVNGDLKQLVATYNAKNGTNATTGFSVHSDMAPNVYITGNPSRESTTARTLEKVMSDMNVKNPLSGERQNLFVAMADPVEEKLLHMVTADNARTPSFTPFAQGDYFLNASSTTPCAGNNLDNCVFLPTITPSSTQTFAWNHGGVQPEVATTWAGLIGPGIEQRQPGDSLWTDHTDIRPTMLELLGLKDTYVTDGRVLTDVINPSVLPKSLKQHKGTLEELGAVYKQIMASFGQFSMDTLAASTAAMASNSPGDKTYVDTENALRQLGADRDAVAAQIRLTLWNAEFGDQSLDENDAKSLIDQANGILSRAKDLFAASEQSPSAANQLRKINHIVVIYEENHSFDNLFGGWESVNGLADADAAHTTQISQAGNPYNCLKQDDVNLTSPPLPASCTDTTVIPSFMSAFTNKPFQIDAFIKPDDVTCPKPTVFGPANGLPKGDPNALPGGCTRDLVHRYYQEQYQLNGGAQNRYVTGSDAIGLTMGYYDTTALPLYKYLHEKGHPDYAIADNFFQAAFGGSFLNHQWLVAAATPVWPNADNTGGADDLHSTLDANGMPNQYPLYSLPAGWVVKDQQLTQSCNPPATRPPLQPAYVCGDYAVNTTQPFNQPYSPGTAVTRRLPLQTGTTIGDELSAAGVDWAWYAGGWANADGETSSPYYTNGGGPNCSDPNVLPSANTNHTYPFCPDGLFQFHHQPLNYFASFAPGTPGRAHLQDEGAFMDLAKNSDGKTCNLKDVSFVKPIGEENEHPGYASLPTGSTHLVELLSDIEGSACAKDTMVIVTYDEFGGQWDHVPPPGQGNDNGPHDIWGPGTRVPAFVLAPHLKNGFVVDSTEHDTTSILATIEHRYGLDPLGSRDATVPDLSSVFDAKIAK